MYYSKDDFPIPLQVMVKRQRTAFPPNFVHSLDGSHMMMTAIACRKAGLTFAGLSLSLSLSPFRSKMSQPKFLACELPRLLSDCRCSWFILDSCMWCRRNEQNTKREVRRTIRNSNSRECIHPHFLSSFIWFITSKASFSLYSLVKDKIFYLLGSQKFYSELNNTV